MKTMTGGEFNEKQPIVKGILITLLTAGLILLVPLVAMQFTNEVAWDLADFLVAGALLIGTGLLYVFAARMVRTTKQRNVVAVALALALLTVWAELAVGIFH